MDISRVTDHYKAKRICRQTVLSALKQYRNANPREWNEHKEYFRKLRKAIKLNSRKLRGRILHYYEEVNNDGELRTLHSIKKIRAVRRLLIFGKILLGLSIVGLIVCIGLAIWETARINNIKQLL